MIDLAMNRFGRVDILFNNAVIMHPGPMNRGVEIDSSVADGDQAIILDQVLNGVAIRMSILYLLLGPDEGSEPWSIN